MKAGQVEDERFDLSDNPIAWFAEMLYALEKKDIDRAFNAKSQLARLGWTTKYRKPRCVEVTSRKTS